MKVSEGWKRVFIVLSAVYWLVALVVSMQSASVEAGPYTGSWPLLMIFSLVSWLQIYAVLAGLVVGVIWILAGFRKPKPDAE
jgi:hypothetical protein